MSKREKSKGKKKSTTKTATRINQDVGRVAEGASTKAGASKTRKWCTNLFQTLYPFLYIVLLKNNSF